MGNQRSSAMELGTLLEPLGGLFVSTPCYQSNPDEPALSLRFVFAGDISHLSSELSKRGPSAPIQGTGTGICDEDTFTPALAEGLERYSASMFRPEQFILASAMDLEGEALDLDTVPRCSEAELSHPKCPLAKPDKTRPIRWVRALSLLDGRVQYVPAVMAYSRAGYATNAERFWLSTSNGCAAQRSYESALLAGICEVVERDAISITWLQRMVLPRIEIDEVPPELDVYWRLQERCVGEIEYHFFDATSDFGLPIVYGIQIAKYNSRVHTLVACSAGLSAVTAIRKVMRDLAHLRFALQSPRELPDQCDDFTDPLDGAAYMAHPDRAGAYEFLLGSPLKKKLTQLQNFKSHQDALQHAIQMLRKNGIQAFVVDLSTDEAIRCGIRVLRVIIPRLQPLSFRQHARFLGHPRLYEAPVRMGRRAFPENQLNPLPQPFA